MVGRYEDQLRETPAGRLAARHHRHHMADRLEQRLELAYLETADSADAEEGLLTELAGVDDEAELAQARVELLEAEAVWGERRIYKW
jgi:hypothetical protein